MEPGSTWRAPEFFQSPGGGVKHDPRTRVLYDYVTNCAVHALISPVEDRGQQGINTPHAVSGALLLRELVSGAAARTHGHLYIIIRIGRSNSKAAELDLEPGVAAHATAPPI